jgi:hypothetical protein
MKRTAPCTSPGQPMPYAVRLEDVPRGLLDVAARELGVEGRSSAAKVRAIAAAHADRDQVTDRVSRLPPLSWLVLEILADAGGRLLERELVAMVRARIGSAPRELTACVEAVLRPLFVARRVTRGGFGNEHNELALLGTVAGTLAPLVRGLTLPAEPPEASVPAAAGSDEREILALATLTAHRRVRINRDGSPNRASVKTLVKTLVIDVDRAQERLVHASVHGLVVTRWETYAPVLPALRAAAERGLRGSEAEAMLEAWLPESGWVPLEQFLRARWRSEIDERAKTGGYAWVGTTSDLRHELRSIRGRGIDVAESGGHTWVRRRTESLELRGDGHVTPNLEVFLGPRAHPSLVVTIGLGAELVRVDNVLTFRLSPASVRTGLGVGLTAQELVEALERVGPHGLADNVRRGVLDFARQARIAELGTATVLRLPADSADAFCAKFKGDGIERATSELVLVPSDWERKDIEQRLEGLGVYVRHRGASPSGRVASEDARPRRRLPPLEPPTPLGPDPELVRRFIEDRKGDFAVSRQVGIEHFADMLPSIAEAKAVSARICSLLAGAPATVERLVLGSERLAVQADSELEAWCARLRPKQRLEVLGGRSMPLGLLPYIALLPEWRAQAMEGARSLSDLIGGSLRLGDPKRYSTEGFRLLRDMANPNIATAIRRAMNQAAKHVTPAELARWSDGSTALEGLDEDDYDFDDDLDDEDDGDIDDYGPERSVELPPRHSFPSLDAPRIAQTLDSAIVNGEAVFVKLKGPRGARVQAVLPEEVRTRAGQKILLATDLETEDARVVQLSDIESVLVLE